MIQKWIESVFLKRVCLALASGIATYMAAHALPVLSHMSAWGWEITVKIDPQKFGDHLGLMAMALSQGGHEWLAAKFPEAGKYL